VDAHPFDEKTFFWNHISDSYNMKEFE
jgi:hypothetical protein